jgi:hypothetical protein
MPSFGYKLLRMHEATLARRQDLSRQKDGRKRRLGGSRNVSDIRRHQTERLDKTNGGRARGCVGLGWGGLGKSVCRIACLLGSVCVCLVYCSMEDGASAEGQTHAEREGWDVMGISFLEQRTPLAEKMPDARISRTSKVQKPMRPLGRHARNGLRPRQNQRWRFLVLSIIRRRPLTQAVTPAFGREQGWGGRVW